MDPIESPLISVIMPAYNTEQYIGEAIQSILDQTYTHFELVICDDGSTDNTYEIAQEYARIDSRIILFRNRKNIGNLRTTNFLFEQCSGEFIAVQDADDVSLPHRLIKSIDTFIAYDDLSIVGTNYCVTDSKLSPFHCGLLPEKHSDIFTIMNKEVTPILYASVMFKKSLLEKIGNFRDFFDRKGYADLDWLARSVENGRALNIKEILYLYRKHSDQFTQSTAKRENLYFKHILLLIIQCHKYRINGKEDFFLTSNRKLMRKEIAGFYHQESKRLFWNNEKLNAIKMLIFAILLSNKRIFIKDLSYMIRFFFQLKTDS